MKKASGDMWMIIVWAIVGLVIAGIVLYIVRGGLSTGSKNIDSLSSCQSRGGTCETECKDDQTTFYRLGCPSAGKPGENCCINRNS